MGSIVSLISDAKKIQAIKICINLARKVGRRGGKRIFQTLDFSGKWRRDRREEFIDRVVHNPSYALPPTSTPTDYIPLKFAGVSK